MMRKTFSTEVQSIGVPSDQVMPSLSSTSATIGSSETSSRRLAKWVFTVTSPEAEETDSPSTAAGIIVRRMFEVLSSLPSEWKGFQFAGNALLARRRVPPSPSSLRSIALMSFSSAAIASPPPSDPLPESPGSWLQAARDTAVTERAVAPSMERRVNRMCTP